MYTGTRHVALFMPSLRGGGAERAMLDIAEGFASQGQKVDLVLVNAEGPYLDLVPENVTVVDLAAPRVLRSIFGLIRYLREHRPEVLLATPCHANFIALFARKLIGLPCRLVIREATTMSQSFMRHSAFNRWKFRQLVRYLYPVADKIVAVSQGVADDLRHFANLPEEKITVVYNPVVTPVLAAKAEEPIDHPWFQPGQLPVVLGVGRFSRAKNFSMLVRAFAHRNLSQKAHLMILGEGQKRLELEALIADLGLSEVVQLPGFVKNPFSFMARSTLCVLSSVQEGFPNVIVQAMAVGTPVVATDCPNGPSEILENGRYGRLVPVGDVAGMARAIDEELSGRGKYDENLRRYLMERATHFSQRKSINAYSEIFFKSTQG